MQEDKDFDPAAADQQQSDAEDNNDDCFYDEEMYEDSDEEQVVEKQFNFQAEFALLVDYQVVSHYVSVLD